MIENKIAILEGLILIRVDTHYNMIENKIAILEGLILIILLNPLIKTGHSN